MLRPHVNEIQAFASGLGFPLFGAAPLRSLPEAAHFQSWLDKGYAASMDYLGARALERIDPRVYFPGARSVVVCGMYYADRHNKNPPPENAVIARYARGRDYHGYLQKKLRKLARFIESQRPCRTKIFVDTAPVLDRAVAFHAGLGWFGKNTCLINRQHGSYCFIGGVLTDLELENSTPTETDHCGSCTRCLDACPTQAFVKPYVLDAGRCISYWTIEHRGQVPDEWKSKLGAHIFGCDICQEVCPWNHGLELKPIAPLADAAFTAFDTPQEVIDAMLETDAVTFPKRFAGRPLRRARFEGLLRNVLTVIANQRWQHYLPRLETLKKNLPPAQVDLHADLDWALQRLKNV